MLKFHSLRIAEIQPDAEDAVALALEVPPELRPEYVGLPDQTPDHRTFDETKPLSFSDSSLPARELSHCFLRLGNFDSGAFERNSVAIRPTIGSNDHRSTLRTMWIHATGTSDRSLVEQCN